MGTLYLVRHGQASFGADDYDNLCDLGARQSRRLGEYFAAKGQRFDAAIHGTLRRHLQTFEGIREGLGQPLEALAWPGLNEYDSAAVIAAVHSAPLERADTPEKFRRHFQILRDGLAQWMRGATQPEGMPSYAGFQEGVAGALAHVRSNWDGQRIGISNGLWKARKARISPGWAADACLDGLELAPGPLPCPDSARPDGSPRARWALISGLTLSSPPSSPHAGAAPPAAGARLRSPW